MRSTGTSFMFFTSSVFMASMSKLFSQFISWFDFYGTFFFYSGVVFCCFAYAYLAMPEHARVSLRQIEKRFEASDTVEKNVERRPSLC